MSSNYTTILRRPGALGFSIAGLIARFPMSMVGISTILAIQELYGSYSAAGTVSAANVVAVAVGAPVLARLVDAHGQSRIMLPATVGSAAALIGLAAAAQMRAPLGVLLALSALAGLLAGSFGSLVRSRWTGVLSTPEQVHTAFSLEAAFDEVAFIIGPVLATVLCTSPALPSTSGWIAAVALQVGGGLWFFSQRATEPTPHRRTRRRLGTRRRPTDSAAHQPVTTPQTAPEAETRPVLRHGAVVAVIAVFLASGAMFGANDVAAVAFATELGMKSAAGTVLAAWGVGSFTAALIYGSRPWGRPLWQQFLFGTTALAVGASTLMFAPNLVVLGVLMALTGMAIAPTVTTGNSITQVSVAPAQLTEGLAWVGTAMNIGVSLGSMFGGHAVDAAGSRGGYLLVAAVGWLAVVMCACGLRTLRRARPHRSLPTGAEAADAGSTS
ncbi:MAG: MFS transporter [Actinomyces ruminicola]|uniref:Predicted arabinose efflux permease, MFS family n=1 Tax=Actinomyces ruminicola TaxID=332524 RepID=A0A1G9RXX9_9ACTO|nr:MFS transporter [Actinomyces ruminicola]MBE6482298.1 MFS transporter [Actinomyces ruminicola]SDM28148.1 Predicted arabinose efflux permease, MFS family [Actinomyces ruminicola]